MTSIYTKEYKQLLKLLIEARKGSKITQQQIADMFRKPQSFVSKIESGERRMDVVEFLFFCKCISINYEEILKKISLE